MKCPILCTHTYLRRTAIEFQQNHIWNQYQKLEKTSRRFADHHHFKKENTFISATTETVFFGRLRVSGFCFLRCVIFLGYALAFYYGMILRYNDEINPSTGEAALNENVSSTRSGCGMEWGTKLRDLHISFGLERLML